jgi:hypothetical protein
MSAWSNRDRIVREKVSGPNNPIVVSNRNMLAKLPFIQEIKFRRTCCRLRCGLQHRVAQVGGSGLSRCETLSPCQLVSGSISLGTGRIALRRVHMSATSSTSASAQGPTLRDRILRSRIAAY